MIKKKKNIKAKRIFPVCTIILFMVLISMPVAHVRAETKYTTDDGLCYQIDYDSGEIEITGYSGSATKIKIPDSIDGMDVTTIKESAFAHCSSLKNITLTAGKLKTIRRYAFSAINKNATFTIKGTKKAKKALKKLLKKSKIGYIKTWTMTEHYAII